MLLGTLAAALGMTTVHAALPEMPIPVKATINPLVPADSIIVNTTLTKDKLWILKGFVMVKSGVTLTIEPGTTIQSDPTVKGTLMVDRGAYLIAAGTAAEPITFQGPNDDRGTWGGIVILGNALSNQDLGDHALNYEGLDWALHAGEDDNDSSGVLTYLRLVNPGYAISIDKELNGLTLCTVGRKTVIHHIQVHRGDDDGIEWFGGSVNTSHLIVTNAVDDSYDTDHGYNGNSQYMIAIQSAETNRPRPGVPLGEAVGDRGLECGSSLGGPGRFTNPIWKNITFIENGKSGGAFEAKEECGGNYENMVLVAGGVTSDTSDWAMQFLSPRTVNGIAALTPHINFTKTFITGKYKKKYNILSGTVAQIALATQILDVKIKAFPFSETNSYGLYKDLSASNPEIINSGAGAIVGNDLWYQGWTLPGTIEFPNGDTPVAPNAGVPTVTLISDPVTLPFAPATFTLNATAADPDGISLLEILKDGIVVASSPTASVSFSVTGAANGTLVYSVRATDNHKVKMTATQDFSFVVQIKPNEAVPTVTLVSDPISLPFAPATFTLNATAADPDGISMLEILKDGIVVASSPTASLSYIVSGAAKGTHAYSVRATDNHEVKLTATQDFSFVVQYKPNDAAPAVTLTRTGDATLFAPATFTLNAGAIDADGIAILEILKGSEVLKSNTGSGSLSLDLSGLAVGNHLYTVRAKDAHSDDSKTTTLDLLVEVKANQAPEVTLTRTGDNLIAPATFTLIATATDIDGTIASLQILQGTEVLETAAAGVLSVPLTGKPAGTYIFTVKATDNNAVDPKTETKELTVIISNPPTVENGAVPIVTLARGDDKTLIAPASFKLFASAADADGIDTLEVLLNGVVVATGTAASLEVPITGKAAGTFTYTARAKDKHATDPKAGNKDLVVEVAAPAPNIAGPTLTITNTFTGILTAPASFGILVEANDADGIDSLQLFLDGNLIGTSITGTGALLVNLATKPAGKYTFTARAKDKHATDSKITTQELVIDVVTPAPPVSLSKPLKDLEGIRFSASSGQNLVLQSPGYGSIKVAIWTLSGRKVAIRKVNLVKGENAIRMGNLRGAYIVRLSTGDKARSNRVVFSVGQ
jgi:hypothetical protein